MTTRQQRAGSAPKLRADRGDEAPEHPDQRDAALAEERFFTHQLTVLSVSSGMVGVCLTAIGLIGIIKSLNKVELIVDDMLAVATMMFLVTGLLSFFAMRTRLVQAWRGAPLAIDVVFCLGMVLVVVATALLTWKVL
jgi:uncharacterized membrane protein YidH (DUF202 family)